MDQLAGSGGPALTPSRQTPMNAGAIKSSQSRQNLPTAPELDYDPFYANQ